MRDCCSNCDQGKLCCNLGAVTDATPAPSLWDTITGWFSNVPTYVSVADPIQGIANAIGNDTGAYIVNFFSPNSAPIPNIAADIATADSATLTTGISIAGPVAVDAVGNVIGDIGAALKDAILPPSDPNNPNSGTNWLLIGAIGIGALFLFSEMGSSKR